MKLIEALNILNQPLDENATTFRLHLSCGFTPLDVKLFLAAHLRRAFGECHVEVEMGLYGDLIGDLERLDSKDVSVVAVVVEWADLDSRLGLRSLGGWRSDALDDIVRSARTQLDRLSAAVTNIASRVAVAMCLPTLPTPPISHTPRYQADALGVSLRAAVEQTGLAILSAPGRCRLVNRERLDALSPLGTRLDVRAELASGFPYTRSHSDIVAGLLASLIVQPIPHKGLITDLDDTLWLGILGEVGIEGIGWTLEQHAQLHGLYQQFLQSLADAGILLGVASKNDPELARKALAHPELLLAHESLMPVEVGWGRKSEAVSRILKFWNIGPEAVVFLDDSAMEVSEVQAAFPEMDCRLFPKDDPAAVWNLLGELRDIFGRSDISEEDRIRSASIRAGVDQAGRFDGRSQSATDFLREANALISIAFSASTQDNRPLELINKTNQFNLNGRRLQEAQWQHLLEDLATVVMVVGYRDRFGPLGRIAVLAGCREDNRLEILHWVMSCRAFSRQIEHACVAQLFEHTGVDELHFAFEATERNGPLREFLAYLAGGEPQADFVLTRQRFQEICPELFHRVEVV